MKRYLAIKYSFDPQMNSPDVNLQKRLEQLKRRQRLANSSEKDVLAARVAHLHLTRIRPEKWVLQEKCPIFGSNPA